ncbi:MAG: glycosyltransferase family 4 protein, partial [Xanthomonadaceae bacterium]|nr:glycosyltransferase family 4 protein [Xanthomonadaceae bacterium]
EQVVLELCRQHGALHGQAQLIVFAPTGQAPPVLINEALRRGLDAEGLDCRSALDLYCIADLRRRLRTSCRAGPVVLHCHDYKSVVYGGLASVGLPLVRIATLHGWLDGGGRLRLYHWLEARMLKQFKRVCAVSPLIVKQLLQQGLDSGRVRRVDNGIDTSRYRPKTGLRNANRARYLQLGTAARLSPEKNLGLLIRAVGKCWERGLEIRLEIVGDGPQRSELEALAEDLGLSGQIGFRGCVDSLEDWYPGLDAFVLSSLREGMPISILEALACGCPVIASDVGAVRELLDGIAGCQVVPADDLRALTNAMMALRFTSGPLPEASERISNRYSSAHMARCYAGIYQEAISS